MHVILLADLVAICILVFGIYFPRHQRRDLVTAYVGVNVGVLAVATTLASVEVGIGLGLGLFGVLSIIRLRSDELGQHEVAYYFASLSLGLLGGLGLTDDWISAGLMVLVVAAMALVDHPHLLPRARSQLIHLDAAVTDPDALRARLEHLLGGEVRKVHVRKLDLVNDTSTVEVHYRLGTTPTPRFADVPVSGVRRS